MTFTKKSHQKLCGLEKFDDVIYFYLRKFCGMKMSLGGKN